MGKFEFLKILKQRMFFLLAFFLIIGNLLTIHMYQKNKSAYYHIYQNKELYERFQNGDTSADVEGYYTEDANRQEQYCVSYDVFLKEMQQRAEKMKALEVYSNQDTYVYRNIEKTCEDFSKLSDVKIVSDNNFGVLELARYEWGIFFVIVFLILFSYYLFYQERNRGLFLLIKGTKKGHFSFVSMKLAVMNVFTAFYVLIQEVSTVCFIGYYYGYGDLSRSIQSVPEFRNCPFAWSVGEAMLVMLAIRLLIAEVLAILVCMLSIVLQNEIVAVLCGCGMFALAYAGYRLIDLGSIWNSLKCINPFFCWNFEQMIGTYLNLNIFGYAIGKGDCAWVVAGIVLFFGVGITMFVFHHSYQIRSESKLEKLKIWLRKKTGIFWRHTNLLRFEFSKIFMQQKKGIVFIVLLLLCVSNLKSVQTSQSYSSAGVAQYHSYMNQISGKVTEESIQFVYDEVAYMDDLYRQFAELDGNTDGKNYVIAMYLESEIDLKSQGLEFLVAQLEYLQSLEGSIYEKYWVDERAYTTLFGDVKTALVQWLLGMFALSIWISGIYPADEKKRILPLIHATKNGRSRLNNRKNLCVVIGGAIIFVLVELPIFLSFYQIDNFSVLAQKMSYFSILVISKDMSLGMFLFLLFLLKMVVFIVWAMALTALSKMTHNETITSVVGIGVAVIIFLICYYLQTSIAMWLLNFLWRM